MDRKEFDELSRKARTERDRGISEMEKKYQERLRALQLTWELANGERKVDSSRPLAVHTQSVGDEGPMTFVREAIKALPAGFTRNDVARFIAAHHGGASITPKQVSSALYKLSKAQEVRISGKRRGNAPALYEAINGQHREDK